MSSNLGHTNGIGIGFDGHGVAVVAVDGGDVVVVVFSRGRFGKLAPHLAGGDDEVVVGVLEKGEANCLFVS
jgi:hypothetical protein